VLLQIDSLNNAFFRLVNNVYDIFGADQFGWGVGHELFKFWTKTPL
jgi:hypothetical protein